MPSIKSNSHVLWKFFTVPKQPFSECRYACVRSAPLTRCKTNGSVWVKGTARSAVSSSWTCLQYYASVGTAASGSVAPV